MSSGFEVVIEGLPQIVYFTVFTFILVEVTAIDGDQMFVLSYAPLPDIAGGVYIANEVVSNQQVFQVEQLGELEHADIVFETVAFHRQVGEASEQGGGQAAYVLHLVLVQHQFVQVLQLAEGQQVLEVYNVVAF